MRPDILILGQGLAGTMLGWALERAGISFAIADPGHGASASWAGAGIVNPITGRRLVKTWRAEELVPRVPAAYAEVGDNAAVFARDILHGAVIRRNFVDERERQVFAAKHAVGDLAPFVGGVDDAGFWIRNAWRIDLRHLLECSREYWRCTGRLQAQAVELTAALGQHELVIDCRGLATAREPRFAFVPWEFSRGEVLEIDGRIRETDAPGVIVNARHWAAPIGPGLVWVGATHEPGVMDPTPTGEGRAALEVSATKLLHPGWMFRGQRGGVRVNLPDKRPLAGRHPTEPRLGLVNGLGAKGALWAPFLSRQWVAHLTDGHPFDSEVAVSRFAT